jgi:ribosome-interacting GTPase 1
VSKSGDARIALVGFPSVGKSTFLSKITKTKSEVAAYSFTTLTAIPGVLEYGGAEIQILDLPGIIEGASEGKGRGRQVISAAKVGHTPLCHVFRWEHLHTAFHIRALISCAQGSMSYLTPRFLLSI